MSQAVSIDARPVPESITEMRFYDGSNNLEYVGYARSQQPEITWALGEFASITVASNVATVAMNNHGLQVGQTVTVKHATVDTDLNGTYIIASVPNANSFTFATAGVADATYNEGSLILSTLAPPTSKPIWAIEKRFYAGGLLVRKAWAGGHAGMSHVLDNMANLSYQ